MAQSWRLFLKVVAGRATTISALFRSGPQFRSGPSLPFTLTPVQERARIGDRPVRGPRHIFRDGGIGGEAEDGFRVPGTRPPQAQARCVNRLRRREHRGLGYA